MQRMACGLGLDGASNYCLTLGEDIGVKYGKLSSPNPWLFVFIMRRFSFGTYSPFSCDRLIPLRNLLTRLSSLGVA